MQLNRIGDCDTVCSFSKKDCSYPIRGVEDNIPGVCFRTGPNGWIDGRFMKLWVREPRARPPIPSEKKRVLFMDNCSGQNFTGALQASLKSINTETIFPTNATDLIEPADSFVIQKNKAAWIKRWDN